MGREGPTEEQWQLSVTVCAKEMLHTTLSSTDEFQRANHVCLRLVKLATNQIEYVLITEDFKCDDFITQANLKLQYES